MKRLFSYALIVSSALVLGACAGADIARFAFHNFIGQNIKVQVPASLEFPDEVVLDLGQGKSVAGRVASAYVEGLLGELCLVRGEHRGGRPLGQRGRRREGQERKNRGDE